MSDFVRRNSGDRQYHYTDVSIAHSRYKKGLVGTRDDDIVAATAAAAHFLMGEPVPAPFSFRDAHEALLALTHYVGDLHQPLHVGAVYLSAKGERVDPDKSGLDPATLTVGGNDLLVRGRNLHAKWDAIPAALTMTHVGSAWVERARQLPRASGSPFSWPAAWASDSLLQARTAFRGVTFGRFSSHHWPTIVPAGYSSRMNAIQREQLTAAGAHLAQLLQAIWP
jgi:hypothetical protein